MFPSKKGIRLQKTGIFTWHVQKMIILLTTVSDRCSKIESRSRSDFNIKVKLTYSRSHVFVLEYVGARDLPAFLREYIWKKGLENKEDK